MISDVITLFDARDLAPKHLVVPCTAKMAQMPTKLGGPESGTRAPWV